MHSLEKTHGSMYCYLWHEKTDIDECKFGERFVFSGQDPMAECRGRIRDSLGVRKDKFDEQTVIVDAIWDVSKWAAEVGRNHKGGNAEIFRVSQPPALTICTHGNDASRVIGRVRRFEQCAEVGTRSRDEHNNREHGFSLTLGHCPTRGEECDERHDERDAEHPHGGEPRGGAKFRHASRAHRS